MKKRKKRPNLTSKKTRRQAKKRITRKGASDNGPTRIDLEHFRYPKPCDIYQCNIYGHKFMVSKVDKDIKLIDGILYPSKNPKHHVEQAIMRYCITDCWIKTGNKEQGTNFTRADYHRDLKAGLRGLSMKLPEGSTADYRFPLVFFIDDERILTHQLMSTWHSINLHMQAGGNAKTEVGLCFSLIT